MVGIQNSSGPNIILSGHSGPDSIFSGIHLTGSLGDGKSTSFMWSQPFGGGDYNKDCDDKNSEGSSCKADCDKKGSDGKSCGGDDEGHKSVTPEPASIMLLGTGLVVLGGVVRRKLLP
jgi:hypothetical protein